MSNRLRCLRLRTLSSLVLLWSWALACESESQDSSTDGGPGLSEGPDQTPSAPSSMAATDQTLPPMSPPPPTDVGGAGGGSPNSVAPTTTPNGPSSSGGVPSLGEGGTAGLPNIDSPDASVGQGGKPAETLDGGLTVEDAGSAAGGAGPSSSGCASGDYLLCEDFEGTAPGDVPSGWSRHGDEAFVADDEAYRGRHSLKLGPIAVWERRIYHDASMLSGTHWGRIYYKVQLPVPDAFVHSTLVALTGDGPTRGRSEYRFIDTVKQAIDTPDVGSRHNWLFNVEPEESGEFGRETSYDWEFDGQWHCAEYFVDSANQGYEFYWDGELELSFEDGAGNYDDSDLPQEFDELRVGWNNYQEAPPGFTAWMDDIAFDDVRIGCD